MSGNNEYSKLLIHSDTTDGSTSFVDSAEGANSPHILTANGHVNHMVSNPLTDGLGCMYLDGATDYFKTPDSDDWNLTTSWAIDFWARLNTLGSQEEFIGQYVNDDNYWQLIASGSNNFNLVNRVGGSYPIDISGAHGLSANEWGWFAASYNGTTYRLFVNGVQVVASVDADQIGNLSAELRIGNCVGNSLDGAMAEVRVSKGTDRGWTSTPIAVPTTQYTSDADTKLLLHCDEASGSNSIIDSSGSAHTMTANGDAIIVRTNVFGDSGIEFDGSEDYISAADNADWHFAANDFALSARFMTLNVGAHQAFYAQHEINTATITWWYHATEKKLYFGCYDRSGSAYQIRFTIPFNPVRGVWYHLELDRDGNTWYMFIEGVAGSKTLITGSYTVTLIDSDGDVNIGKSDTGPYYVNGFMDEIMVKNGEFLNNANFTPPTKPYSQNPINYTPLLTDIALRYTPTPVITNIAPASTEINNTEIIVVTGQSLQYVTEVIWGLTTLGAFNTAFSNAFDAAEYIGPSLPFTLVDENTIYVDVSGLFIGAYPLVITSLGKKYESPENLTITRQPYTPTLTDIALNFTPLPFLDTFVPLSSEIDALTTVLITGGRLDILTSIKWYVYDLPFVLVDDEHVSVVMEGLPLGSHAFVGIIDGNTYQTPASYELFASDYSSAPTISRMLRYGKYTGNTTGTIKFPLI